MSVVRTPLPTTVAETARYAAKNGRIVAWASYGEHVDIKCQHEVEFTTKNIDYIGARSIFAKKFMGGCQAEGGCSYEVVVPVDWQDKLVPIGICKCQWCDKEICEESKFSNPNYCGYCRK